MEAWLPAIVLPTILPVAAEFVSVIAAKIMFFRQTFLTFDKNLYLCNVNYQLIIHPTNYMKKLILFVMAVTMALNALAQQTLNLGGDISMLPQYESANIPYLRSTGAKIDDVIAYMKTSCKFNSMRVRLFVNPDNSKDISLVQDLEYVKNLGKRIKDQGLDLMVDFHYSDSWADPSNQTIPASWKDTSTNALADSVYAYTKRCLEYLKANGATPDFVQVGNEVSYGMLWRNEADRCYSSASNSTWKRFTTFLNAGAKAVREVTPDAKIILHIERAGNASDTKNFFTRMKANEVDYDIIGLSYYPFWHKSLSTLSGTLNSLETAFPDKPVQIVETAYYYQWFPVGETEFDDTTSTWPGTAAGQKAFIEDLCTELAKHPNVTGLYYWFPEANGTGVLSNNDPSNNRGLWDCNTHKINSGLLKLQNFLTEKEAVGIQTIKAPQGTSPIYNLNGQRISSLTAPGIYVKDSKKYLKMK